MDAVKESTTKSPWRGYVLGGLLLVLSIWHGLGAKQDTTYFLQAVSFLLLKIPPVRWLLYPFVAMGYQAWTPLWLSSKLYYVFNISITLWVVWLFLRSRPMVLIAGAAIAFMVCYGVVVSQLARLFHSFYLLEQAYAAVMLACSPFAAFILVPLVKVVYMLFQQGKQQHTTKVE